MAKSVPTTEKVTAFGLIWTLTTNSEEADLERRDMARRGRIYAFTSRAKPSEQSQLFSMLFPYYPDIISSVLKLEQSAAKKGVPAEDLSTTLLLQLVQSAEAWVELVKPFRRNRQDRDFDALEDAARKVNPHWHNKSPLAELDEGTEEEQEAKNPVKEALKTLEKVYGQLDPENVPDGEEPEDEEVMDQVRTVVEYAEEVSEKKD